MLVGPSGCGKTTTLKMINRLIEPSGGRLEVLGTEIRELPAHELRRQIGYVIQQIGLFPHRTIAENIATVPKLLGWDKARTRARVEELTELVGLDPEHLARYPSSLSGGQQQRVGVARALAADPPILLMDEPYSAVDPIVRGRLQDELLALQGAVHKTIVRGHPRHRRGHQARGPDRHPRRRRRAGAGRASRGAAAGPGQRRSWPASSARSGASSASAC